MRIVGGKFRGREIIAPAGQYIRPTADRVRESVFNILEYGKTNIRLEGARVLDAFAGTGALGLEALSRGAKCVTFMDSDTKACRINIDALAVGTETTLIRSNCLSPPKASKPCDLIFLDPPYNKGLAPPALEALIATGWITENSICVVELAAKEPFETPSGFAIIEERRYGAARVILVTSDELANHTRPAREPDVPLNG